MRDRAYEDYSASEPYSGSFQDDIMGDTDFAPYERHHRQLSTRTAFPDRQMQQTKCSLDQRRYYIALIYDESSGKLSRQSSPSLRPFKNSILHEASQKLMNVLQSHFVPQKIKNEDDMRSDREETAKRPRSEVAKIENSKQDTPRPYRTKKIKSKPFMDDLSSASQNTSFSSQKAQNDMEREDVVEYRMGDHEAWEKWFGDAFRAVQQVSCRVIAKEWIKLIHPKKQSTHPYNGKNPTTGEKGDPDSTKPMYWPPDVIHKEPDHINKEARVKLLVHLLMNTPHKEIPPPSESRTGEPRSDKEINAVALKEALDQKSSERGMVELKKKYAIIEQIIHVRTQLELFEEGGYDDDALFSATNYVDFGRAFRNEDDSDEPPDEALEVITELRDDDDSKSNDEDGAKIPAIDTKDVLMSETEPLSCSRPSNIGGDAPKAGTKTERKANKEDCRPSTGAHQKKANSWVCSALPFDPGLNSAPVHDFGHFGHPLMNHEAYKMREEMHAQARQPLGSPVPEYVTPVGWHATNGRMDLSGPYDDVCLASPGVVSDMNQNTYIEAQFGYMPQPTCGGPPHYFAPAGGTPYHCMQQPPSNHNQTMQAYYPH